jgi:hypothetical protein
MSEQDNTTHRLYCALLELVRLKEMKELLSAESSPEKFMQHVEMEDDYKRRKPLAWLNARQAIKAYENL